MPEPPVALTGPVGARKGFKSEYEESVMMQSPHEFAIGGVLMPPMLIAALLASVAAIITAGLLNRCRLSKYVFYPPLVFLALMIIYTILIESFMFGA
jgi:hypothetical protein